MIVRGEANRVPVPIPPREWLDRVLGMRRIKLGAQDRTIADTVVQRALEGSHGRTWALRPELGVATGFHSTSRVEDIIAQHDILAGNVLLVRAVAVVPPDDAAVGRRPLRPVDPPTLKRQLFRRVVAGR